LPADSLATFRENNFFGAMTKTSGFTGDDIRWEFNGNAGLPDTHLDSMMSLNSNVTETVIAVAGTPVKVAGTFVVERESKFTGDTTGRSAFNAERVAVFPVDVVTVVRSASGNNKDITVCLALNGTVIPGSVKSNRVSATEPKSNTVLWQLSLSQNDFLEIFVSNESDTTNLVVDEAILRIN